MTRTIALLFVSVLVAPTVAVAQDTTAPVPLAFSISPLGFDASQSAVPLDWCLTVQDDLSGPSEVLLIRVGQRNGAVFFQQTSIPFVVNGSTLVGEACGTVLIAQFAPFDVYEMRVRYRDAVGNQRDLVTNDPAPSADLCAVGPCEVVNRSDSGLPDSDGDGVPDDADNCAQDPNSDQSDADLDLLGDVCDPFPNDRDNEQAQCDEDLDMCLAEPAFADADGDGEHDDTDECPETADAEPVDAAGCSVDQFCERFDPHRFLGIASCRLADWQNDEPVGAPRDCRIRRLSRYEFVCRSWGQ